MTKNLGPPHPKFSMQFDKATQEVYKILPKDVGFHARDYCEIIHIGVVCSGFNSNIYLHALLKSLFLTRVNPVHFHLLVSNESERVIKELFKTWQMPQVMVTFYNIKHWLKDVRWVPNNHYSGNYGLLKLVFPKIVPFNVTRKLLILDTDIIVNGDIYLLWKLFGEFNYKQAVGIVENQSEYYLGKLSKMYPWPALGMGFNSGVMLYDLEKLSAMKWDTLWVNLTKRLSLVYGQADLGDQDIINALIVENPDIVFKLPCYWNTQMSDNSLSSSCYQEYKPMIVHWNSPKKFNVKTKDGEKFKGLAKSVFEFNGYWFRKYPLMCSYNSKSLPMVDQVDECGKFHKHKVNYYRTLLFFREYKYVPDEIDITYVSHLSFDRFDLMEDVARIWTGPISFTLYVSDEELSKCARLIEESEVLSDRTDITYHAVFKDGDFYPINTLRNTGLKNVNTPYVFLTDIDFMPMKKLFEIIKDNIRSMGDLKKKALVIPAFEVTNKKVPLPTNKIQLIESLNNHEVRPFLLEIWSKGHAPTDYEKWRTELEPYEVKWQADYEPYIVVKSNVVKYDERFLGFGWNKVSHIMELEAQNYEFIVLSDVFIIHQPHNPSCDNVRYKKSTLYRQCLQILKKRFVQDLQKKYNRTFEELNFSLASPKYKRKKRELPQESTTNAYDSTDFFLVWGGKEKAEGKIELKKNYRDKENFSKKKPENDYYYYDYEFPYNLTRFKSKKNKSEVTDLGIKLIKGITSSEEHDYEYDEEDLKFKNLHDSTMAPILDNSTILTDADLVDTDKDNVLGHLTN